MGIDTKDFLAQHKGHKKYGNGENQAPTHSCPKIEFPLILLMDIPIVSGKNGTRLPHTIAEAVIEITEVHSNCMNRIGNCPKLRDHARINDHTDPLKSLLAEDPAKYTKELTQICTCQTIISLIENAPCIKHTQGKEEGPYSAPDCPECGAKYTELREWSKSEDQKRIQDDVDDISLYID